MRWRRALAYVTAAALLASAGGCYRIVIRGDTEVGRAPVLHEHAWHHGFVAGIAEFPPTGYRLDQLCPQGWSEIEVHTSVANALVSAVVGAFSLYTPQTISIRCAATGARYEVEMDREGSVAAVTPLLEGKVRRRPGVPPE